jgi:N-formylglutamate deformylase
MELYRYLEGKLPVIISVPHAGTQVPEEMFVRFTKPAKFLPDTDWHVDRLYGFTRKMGVHMLIGTMSRYVIDLNRAPDDTSLYPGKFTTGLCPLTLFDGSPIYMKGKEPDKAEVLTRTVAYWQPYHEKLRSLLRTLKAQHPRVVLFDAHSIASTVPTLFDGTLPDLNFGTVDGASADNELADALLTLGQQSGYSSVLNGRFKGGYITRQYGRPAEGIHAVQLELAQRTYMQETHPYDYDDTKVVQLQTVLRQLVEQLIDFTQ